MRIVMVGAGGVGGYFGGRLAQAGNEVVFIARGAHLEAIQSQGLRVESISGNFTVSPAQATDRPSQVGPADVIFVAVKAWQVPDIAAALHPMLGENTFVVPLQNGVEAADQLAQELGRERVIGGLCRISALLAEPGLIRHVGIEPFIALGELEGPISPRVEALASTLRAAGITVSTPDDIQVALWEKFVFIAAVSGVGAVTRAPIGILRSVPETRQLLLNALQEVVDVGHAQGVRLSADTASRIMAMIDGTAPGVTASMQRDLMEGRRSELDAQNGAVVRLGRAAGVPTPVHACLFASLLPQELRARGEIEF